MIKKIGIIVVNWNSGGLTNTAIKHYLNYKSSKIECEIVVVDNASSDNSLHVLKQPFITLIANTANMGFGHACNQAFKILNTDYILLLNPDTISSTSTLETLTAFLDNHPAYAVTGPQQQYDNGTIMRSCGRFPTFKTACYELSGISKMFPQYFTPAPIMLDFDHIKSRDVDHIMGSYMLIRKSVIDETGFMDPEYFVYAEDIDLSKRIAQLGFKSYFNSGCSIIHTGGGSGHNASTLRLFYSISSRKIYWQNHLSRFSLMILTFLSLTIEPPLRILRHPLQAGIIIKAYMLYVKEILK